MTNGQQLALEQLRRVAVQGDALEIVGVRTLSESDLHLLVDVSVSCKDMPRKDGGLPLRNRERLTIWVDREFPYSPPSIFLPHKRFAGHPHVQWERWPCLYQAPQTEWSVSAGMFGFIHRLEMWLRHGALNELDPPDGPLHPPVTYNARGPLFIPRVDAPAGVQGSPWLGYIGIQAVGEHRVDLVQWSDSTLGIAGKLLGTAILLGESMPFEFPSKLGHLVRCLDERGAPLGEVFNLLHSALACNGKDNPLYVVLGAPMRRTAGGPLRQHLTAWRLDPFAIELLDLDGRIAQLQSERAQLREQLGAEDDNDDLFELQRKVTDLFKNWADSSDITWCRVREDRPEVTVRRDTGRPAGSFSGKHIELWGCGALGGYIAEWLVRAGVQRIILRDNGMVTPGILVRQPYSDRDIGRLKVEALAERLRAINPKCEIDAIAGDVLDDALGTGQCLGSTDLIIDATASNLVLARTEEVWRTAPESRRSIASIAIDRSAERLLVVFTTPRHSGGPLDVVRRMKLVACRDGRSLPYLDAFFPNSAPPPFQPEPGCSDATFLGSAADVAIMAAAATNYVGAAWQKTTDATALGCFQTPGGRMGKSAELVEHEFANDHVFVDPQTGYEIRVDATAWRSLEAWQSESRRRHGPEVETGGLLFGEVDEHLKVIWVSEASGPPTDSQHAAQKFTCGIDGTRSLNAEKARRTRKSVQYVGTWHTHPESAAIPSLKDFGAMAALLTQSPTPIERLLLLIIGQGQRGSEVTTNVFLRSEFEALRKTGHLVRDVQQTPVDDNVVIRRPRVGIALSGGGSRAMAFHLGCLRALDDLGVLSQADVLSTVSGGSVIGAMYAYSDDSFSEFEARVRAELGRGFTWAIARRTILSPRLLEIAGTKLISGVAADASFIARFIGANIERLLPRKSKGRGLLAERIQPPLRRWASRTQAFEQTLRDRLFGATTLGDTRRGQMNVVINACELRTGTAFRFGSRESGSWRYGVVEGNQIDVATAVAASAAYPALLPAIDRYLMFVSRSGEIRRERVILTDGGVYENLGVSCMTPDRDDSFSTNVYRPPYIICCDAGPGQFGDVVMPYGWTTRMRRAFEATFRQTQHGLQKQIHLWRQYGEIKGFVYSYLGQQDERLPHIPPDLTRREEVIGYPTDFSPMSNTDIDLLSRRGEQLTRLLIDHYCPEL